MKNLIILCAFLCVYSISFSQDTLYVYTGAKIACYIKSTENKNFVFTVQNDPLGKTYRVKQTSVDSVYYKDYGLVTDFNPPKLVSRNDNVWGKQNFGLIIGAPGVGMTYERYDKNQKVGFMANVGYNLPGDLAARSNIYATHLNYYFFAPMAINVRLFSYLGKNYRRFRPYFSMGAGMGSIQINRINSPGTHTQPDFDPDLEEIDRGQNSVTKNLLLGLGINSKVSSDVSLRLGYEVSAMNYKITKNYRDNFGTISYREGGIVFMHHLSFSILGHF